jgi:Flp pilus assembly pilin Flp
MELRIAQLRGTTTTHSGAHVREERGQALVEYALIVALVSLASIVALGFLGGKINDLFSKAGNSLNSVQLASGGTEPGTGAGTGTGTSSGTGTGGGSDTAGSGGSGGGSADTVAPVLGIHAPADGATGVATTPVYAGVCGTASSDLPTITITVVRVAGNPDSGSPYGPFTTTCSAGAWSFTHPGPGSSQGLKNGRTYDVTATQSDSAGNTATDTSRFTT